MAQSAAARRRGPPRAGSVEFRMATADPADR